jgi:hypothetical protein
MFTAVAALSIAYPVSANLITNGGFETGDFTGWAHVGGDVDGDNPHSGNFAASLDFGHLQQSVATTPGTSYTINFFSAYTGVGLFNSFSVSWGGVTIFSAFSEPPFDYGESTFNVTASDPFTELVFRFDVNFPVGFYFLDDVSVNPSGVGAPDAGSTLPLLGFGLLGLTALRRRLGC